MEDKIINNPKRLITKMSHMGSSHVSDEFYAIAFNIEEALLGAGAQPGKDYTYMDLFNMAQPFVLEMFKSRDYFEYDYPADQVLSPPKS